MDRQIGNVSRHDMHVKGFLLISRLNIIMKSKKRKRIKKERWMKSIVSSIFGGHSSSLQKFQFINPECEKSYFYSGTGKSSAFHVTMSTQGTPALITFCLITISDLFVSYNILFVGMSDTIRIIWLIWCKIWTFIIVTI